MIFELPDAYPNEVPTIRIKNQSPDIIDNNKILDFERQAIEKAEQSVGAPMIYEVCESIREIISEMNELILKKLREIEDRDSIDHALKSVKISSDAPMTFTPVTQETFKRWCDAYKERMFKIKEEMRTEKDLK